MRREDKEKEKEKWRKLAVEIDGIIEDAHRVGNSVEILISWPISQTRMLSRRVIIAPRRKPVDTHGIDR